MVRASCSLPIVAVVVALVRGRARPLLTSGHFAEYAEYHWAICGPIISKNGWALGQQSGEGVGRKSKSGRSLGRQVLAHFFFDGIARIPPVFGAHPVLQSSRLPEYGKIPTLYLWGQPASQPAYQIGWYQQRKSGGAPLAKKKGSRSALKHGLADVSGVNGRNRWTK